MAVSNKRTIDSIFRNFPDHASCLIHFVVDSEAVELRRRGPINKKAALWRPLKMVEVAGIEPASNNLPFFALHA